MADKTDKRAFSTLMVMAAIVGIIAYYVFTAATPKPGIVDSVYRQELPPAPAASATDAPGESSSEAIDESAFANKVEVKILQGSATQGNPAYGPDPASATSDALVTWVNEDTVPHTATSGTGPEDPEVGNLFDTSIIMPAATAQIDTATVEAGEHPFHCTVHPFMTVTITVQ